MKGWMAGIGVGWTKAGACARMADVGALDDATDDALGAISAVSPVSVSAGVEVSPDPGSFTLTCCDSSKASAVGCVELSSDFVTEVFKREECAGEEVADRLARLEGWKGSREIDPPRTEISDRQTRHKPSRLTGTRETSTPTPSTEVPVRLELLNRLQRLEALMSPFIAARLNVRLAFRPTALCLGLRLRLLFPLQLSFQLVHLQLFLALLILYTRRV